MKNNAVWIKVVFALSGLYDLLFGLVFLCFWRRIYLQQGITPPNHHAYIQFPALLLMLFGVMFFQIAKEPSANRNMIPYGMGLKAAYCIVIFWHVLKHAMPFLWVPFAWIDLVFFILFAAAYRLIGAAEPTPASS
jgi:hypothetical protein